MDFLHGFSAWSAPLFCPHLYSRMRSRRDFVVGLHPLTTPGHGMAIFHHPNISQLWTLNMRNKIKPWKHQSILVSQFFWKNHFEVNPKIWSNRWYRWRSTWQIHHIKVFPGWIFSVEGNCLFLWLVAYGSCDATSAAEQEIVVERCSSYAAWLTYTSSNSKVHESNIFVERLHAVPPHARIHGNWLCKLFTNTAGFLHQKTGRQMPGVHHQNKPNIKYPLVN